MISVAALALFLTAQQSAPPAKPMGTFDEPASPRTFHSAGVHGAIDAGGYAASASVKTQTEFFDLLTDLQVASLRSACAPSDAVRQQAIELLSRGEFAEAAEFLEKHSDGQPATKQLLGLAYEGLGQCGAAAEQFAAAPPDGAGLFAQSVALLLEGAPDRAETIARHSPGTLNRLSLGAALFQRGDTAQALNVFLDAASADPAEKAAFQFVAIALRSADSAGLSHAVSILTSLSQQQPENGSAHYALACALSGPAIIETELKRAVALDPHLADAHFRLGALYAEREDVSAAIDEYNAALAGNRRLIEAHYRLSQLYMRHGDLQLAQEQLEIHRKLRAQQKLDLESGRIRLQFPRDMGCLKR